MPDKTITRKQLIDNLNEDLSREYQAIIAYVVYSKMIKGAAFTDISRELEKHAAEELEHAPAVGRIYLLEVMQISVLGNTSKAKKKDVLPHPLSVIPGQMGDWRTVGKPADRRIHRLIMDVAEAA